MEIIRYHGQHTGALTSTGSPTQVAKSMEGDDNKGHIDSREGGWNHLIYRNSREIWGMVDISSSDI